MGTSVSSSGPGPGVPLIPPWVPPWIPPVEPDQPPVEPGDLPPDGDPDAPQPSPQEPQESTPTQDVAPDRRFRNARLYLGRYGSSGSRDDLRKGLRHYVKHGIGGASTGAHRMAGTARTAGVLHSVLSSLSEGQAPPIPLGVDPRSLAGRSAREVIDIIIEAACPVDGTQDSEASRAAIYDAQADLLQQFPDVDLAALAPDQIDLMVERYIAHDLCYRIDLDVGKSILTHAPDVATAVRRLDEMKQYVIETVAAHFRQRLNSSARLSRQSVAALAQTILRETLDVFEEYVE